MKTVEQWKIEKKTKAWLFAATKFRLSWGVGKELSEADYDAAMKATAGIRIGVSKPTTP